MSFYSIKLSTTGLAVFIISGAGVGISTVFGTLINAVTHNLNMNNQLFSYAILNFALIEAIILFSGGYKFIIIIYL